VATQGKCKTMAHVVHIRLDYIWIKCYYMWMFVMCSILYHKHTFFKSCNFLLIPLDWLFPFVWQFYACPSPLYFSEAFQHRDLTISFESIHNKGSFGHIIIHINTSLHFPPYHNSPPYLCFYFICRWYAYCWLCFKCDNHFFTIIGKDLKHQGFPLS